jgi:NAD+ diphosphatase
MPTSRFRSFAAPPSGAVPTRFVLCGRKGLLVRGDDQPLLGRADLAAVELPDAELHVLGELDGAVVATAGWPEDRPLPEGLRDRSLRSLFGALDEVTASLAGRAVQVVQWDQTHRFCGRCATPTVREPRERCRRCPSCELSAYPRVAPAVIVLVTRGEEALLARSSKFPLPFFSTLAGFTEAGETLEECIHREIEEEVGISVTDLRYFGSQPWPFPHSLMIGFLARHAAGEIVVDGEEIAEAGWFRRDALPMVPPPQSIAGRMIRSWVDSAS